jgi:hypothetical protein
MFKSNLVTYPNVNANHSHSYGENLGLAARAFLAALLAVEPAKLEAAATNDRVSERVRLKGVEELYSLAKQFDSTMPNQAAELRYLAGRDPSN